MGSEDSCINCGPKKRINRTLRILKEPRIHCGTIASGSRVMKDGRTRGQVAREINALCFEMEKEQGL